MRRPPPGRTLTHVAALAALAATLLAAPAARAGGGGGCHEPVTEGRGTVVAMAEFCYAPSILYVEPGETVTFTNLDSFPHPTHGRNGGDGQATFSLEGQQGTDGTVTFDEPGTFPYACMAHPGMVGQIVVGDGAGDAVPVAATTAPGAAETHEAGTAAAGSAEAGGASILQLGGAAAAGAVLALLGGFLGGFLVRRRKRPAEPR